ncbi:hypothetical protein LXL04_024170 [Taraxacum kok-saghyz]
MEENKESSSLKHQNSDLDDGSSSIDNENKLLEATSETDDELDHNKISDEAENPLLQNKISGEVEEPPIYNKISVEAEDAVIDNIISTGDDNSVIHNKYSGEAKDPLIYNEISGEAGDLLIHSKITGEAVDTLINTKTSDDASPTSFSSSSHLLEIDYDENAFDISFSISEEDEDNPNTRQWSMVSASPVDGPPEVQDPPLSPQNGSPKQPPVPQVMERTESYDPDRIPASTFTRKSTNNTEWSADSNDSLFSIHLGRSGELNRADSSFQLPTVIEATSDIDQKSAIGEIQNQSDVPIVHANENEVNPSERPCDSKTTPSSPPPPAAPPGPEGKVAEETKSGKCVPIPKGRCRCFNCFSCCTFCG